MDSEVAPEAEWSGGEDPDKAAAQRPDGQRLAEEHDPQVGLAGLARLATNRLGLEELLTRVGVHSVLSLRLTAPDGVVGAMNVYAHDQNAFDERAAELGEIFAGPAAIVVQTPRCWHKPSGWLSSCGRPLEARGVTDRAVGIVMSRSGSTEDEALAKLRTLSHREQQKLVAVAGQIIDEAVRRAQARHRRD